MFATLHCFYFSQTALNIVGLRLSFNNFDCDFVRSDFANKNLTKPPLYGLVKVTNVIHMARTLFLCKSGAYIFWTDLRV